MARGKFVKDKKVDYYIVAPGDRIWDICRDYQKKVRLPSTNFNTLVDLVVVYNKKKYRKITRDHIEAGWKLRMPYDTRFFETVDYIIKEMQKNPSSASFRVIKASLSTGKAMLDITRPLNPVSLIDWRVRLVVALTAMATAYGGFTLLVMPGGDWDHKGEIQYNINAGAQYSGDFIPNPYEYGHDIWSNIHYGYIGLALGFSEYELLSGAGVAQLLPKVAKKLKDLKFPDDEIASLLKSMKDAVRGNTGAFKRLDDPLDQAAAKIGFDLWKSGRGSLSRNTLLPKLRAAAGRLNTRRP